MGLTGSMDEKKKKDQASKKWDAKVQLGLSPFRTFFFVPTSVTSIGVKLRIKVGNKKKKAKSWVTEKSLTELFPS